MCLHCSSAFHRKSLTNSLPLNTEQLYYSHRLGFSEEEATDHSFLGRTNSDQFCEIECCICPVPSTDTHILLEYF